MKKTLAAVAVLGAFAGSAFAADVTIYGRLDTGLLYQDSEVKFNGDVIAEDTSVSMESGGSTTSRLGIKGSEEISENLTVGFVLEKKLMSDDGTGDNDRFFDRESTVYAKTNFGTFYFGRVNSMWSDGGSTNFWAGNYVVFGTGTGGSIGAGAGLMVSHSRADNRISYISPEFAGFTVYAEYSMGANEVTNGTREENTREGDRPAALGVNYKNGAFGAGLVVSTVFENDGYTWDKTDSVLNHEHGTDPEDQWTVNLGTSYDFGFAKVMLAGQYYKDANTVGLFTDEDLLGTFDELEGYAVALGADIPLAGGTLTVGATYGDGEDKADGSTVEFDGYNVAAQYKYPLSKRTRIYGTIGYTDLDANDDTDDAEYKSFGANIGIAHYF